MSENRKSETPWGKIIFGCLGLGLLGVLAAGGAGYYFLKDKITLTPEKAAEIQQRILPGAELPEGYVPQMGMNLVGIEMVIIRGPGSHMIMLMAGTKEAIEQGSKSSRHKVTINGQQIDEGDLEPLGTVVFSVGGQEVTFTKSRMTNDKNVKQLHHVGTLTRPDGRLVQIMFVGPEADLDTTGIQQFLASANFGGKTMPPVKDGPAEQPEQPGKQPPTQPAEAKPPAEKPAGKPAGQKAPK